MSPATALSTAPPATDHEIFVGGVPSTGGPSFCDTDALTVMESRPFHCGGAVTFTVGSGMCSLMVTGMVMVFSPSAKTARQRRTVEVSAVTRGAFRVNENRSVAATPVSNGASVSQ